MKKIVLAIPDLHCPFEHKDSLAFLKAVKNMYKPTDIVCLGDEIDAHALGDYDHDPDGMSAGQELEKAIESLQPFYKLFPNVKVCTSNHTSRPYRQAFKHGIPRAFLRDYAEFLLAPKGWSWADSWEVDGVVYEHGEGFSGAAAAIKSAQQNMQSTVIGHIHAFAGIQFSANSKHLIFGFNAGCLIDRHAYAFAYGKKIKSKPILGCGIISDGVPTFIPMLLNGKSRWVGTI
jgi:hypothetical protein